MLRTLRERVTCPGIWLPGVYVVLVTGAGIHALACAGDMCALALGVLLMPWTLLPLPVAWYSNFIIISGFMINTGLLYGLGRGLEVCYRRFKGNI